MSKVDQINEFAEELDEDLLFLGIEPRDFEEAIIGIVHRFGANPIVSYDYDKVIKIFENQFKESGSEDPYQDAIEWFDFNVIGAWMGDGTPCFVKVL